METPDGLHVIAEKIKGIRTTDFTTINSDGHIISRPMATQDLEFDGTVWFMTSKESEKVAQIGKDPRVNLMYQSDDRIRFVSLSGKAETLHDQARIEEFWNPFYKAWFEGPEDPSIILIKVAIERAEYWDTKGGKLAAYANIAKAAITGDQGAGEDDDENEVLTFLKK